MGHQHENDTAAATDDTAIRRLLVSYATAIDTKDWPLFRRLFADDCVMDTGTGEVAGAAELTEHMARLHEGLDGSMHRVTNMDVRVDGDRASATTYLDAVLVRRRDPGGPTFRVCGSYEDDLVRTSDGWRIARRAFKPLWFEGNTGMLTP